MYLSGAVVRETLAQLDESNGEHLQRKLVGHATQRRYLLGRGKVFGVGIISIGGLLDGLAFVECRNLWFVIRDGSPSLVSIGHNEGRIEPVGKGLRAIR
jgi:hypothetical protein